MRMGTNDASCVVWAISKFFLSFFRTNSIVLDLSKFWWDEEGLSGRRRRERAQTTHLASFGLLVSVPVVYAPCIYVPKVGSDRLEPHHDRLWLSRSKPTFRPGWTAHNRLCAVRPGFSYFEKIYEPVAVPVWPKKGKKPARTGPSNTINTSARVYEKFEFWLGHHGIC